MKCKKVKLLLAPCILGDLAGDLKLLGQLERHLRNCSCCIEEYQNIGQTIGFVEEYKDIFTEVFAEIDLERTKKADVQKQRWWEIFAENTEKPNSFQLFRRIGAVAACLVVGLSTWVMFSNYSKPHPISQTSSGQVASAPKFSVKVELVRPSGNIAVPTGQKIATGNELKTLLINGKHQMVMNINTSLSIEPLTVNNKFGCSVKLDSGEIYTHVEHDGNPFVVQTANGKAIITGTTFDVKAEGNSTTLVVTEGAVRFKSERGLVNVGTGQSSQIVNQSAPTKPAVCNVGNLTAWAIGYKPKAALAQAELSADSWQPPLLSLGPEPIKLDRTNYKSWVEEKREWFSKNFPWIFELKDALAKEGIEVDFPELLIKSGDVWQFMCLDETQMPARFSNPDFDSLLKTAIFYGFDKEWLSKNVLSAKVALGQKSFLQNTLTGLKAFDHWLKYADDKGGSPYGFYTSDACRYIIETRSLIWFAVKKGKFNLMDTQRTKVLDLLQQEVEAACNCQNEVLYPPNEHKPSCDEKLCKTMNPKVFDYIEITMTLEERVGKEIHH